MTKTEISVKYLRGIFIESSNEDNQLAAASLCAQAMQLGFSFSQNLLLAVNSLSITEITDLYDELIPALRKFKGADVKYKVMYPGFPKEVMDKSSLALWMNAMGHYWSKGLWSAGVEALPKEYQYEHVNYIELDLIDEQKFNSVFTKLLGSNDSISDYDKQTIFWFLDNVENLVYPEKISFKENLCYLAAIFLQKDKDITPLVSTATDVLRIATSLSGGDISLATNTKFKSLPNKTRKTLVSILEGVINEEDIRRHKNKWNILFHNLHVGEMKFATKVNVVADKIRNNVAIHTFNGKVEKAIRAKDTELLMHLLKKRPGDFARRLDHLIRETDSEVVIYNFIEVAEKIPTRLLLQLLGNLKIRNRATPKKTIFPKGNMAKAISVQTKLEALPDKTIARIKGGIESVLIDRFSSLEPLGKVWIDPQLKDCPIPTQMRSASESFNTVARGTRLPIGDKNTLRFFIHWVGRDIDLHGTLYDANFKLLESISYYHLRSHSYDACHSGDLVDAPGPDGAAEFIDITMDKALAFGARYVMMDVRVYNGPTFKEHETCYAGWMSVANPHKMSDNSSRSAARVFSIFDPKKVVSKIKLDSNSKVSVPVIFDLQTKQAIWADLVAMPNPRYSNNVKNNKASSEQILEAMIGMSNKTSLFELFELHTTGRGELVATKEEADHIFSLYEGTTPFDIMEINASYLV